MSIQLSGPASAWFGAGFGASSMSDQPWTVIVNSTGVFEYKLGVHQSGTLLAPTVTVVSSTTDGSVRIAKLTVPLTGGHFNFNSSAAALPIISAVGSTQLFAYHKDKAPASMVFAPSASSTGACVCSNPPPAFGQASGSLRYQATAEKVDTGSGEVKFVNSCPPQPAGDLLAMKNPTCDLRTYSGGQIACHHMWSLLDADQEIPWPEQPLEYSLKFR